MPDSTVVVRLGDKVLRVPQSQVLEYLSQGYRVDAAASPGPWAPSATAPPSRGSSPAGSRVVWGPPAPTRSRAISAPMTERSTSPTNRQEPTPKRRTGPSEALNANANQERATAARAQLVDQLARGALSHMAGRQIGAGIQVPIPAGTVGGYDPTAGMDLSMVLAAQPAIPAGTVGGYNPTAGMDPSAIPQSPHDGGTDPYREAILAQLGLAGVLPPAPAGGRIGNDPTYVALGGMGTPAAATPWASSGPPGRPQTTAQAVYHAATNATDTQLGSEEYRQTLEDLAMEAQREQAARAAGRPAPTYDWATRSWV